MKRLLSLFAAAFMLLAAGCSQGADDSVVLPPTRIGESISYPSLEKSYTFETAFSEADAVARIKVGNWLSEDNEIHSTYFDATVLQCFKGNIPESFILIQDGSSNATMDGYPLFTYGNELLVFLNQATGFEDEIHYWIIGAYTTVMDVVYDNSETRYYATRFSSLVETMDITPNCVDQKDIVSEIYNFAIISDPLVADIADEQHLYSYIFSESDVIDLINSY